MHPTDISQEPIGFTPLHSAAVNCLLGYRSTAKAGELYDEAMLRQHAVLGLLDALTGTSNLHELCSESLHGCIQAIRILCSDTAALHAGAYEAMQRDTA